MRFRRGAAVLLASVLLASLPGCSFFFVDGPPRKAELADERPRCTDSYGRPIFDAVWWGAPRHALTIVSAAKAGPNEIFPRELVAGIGVGAVVLGVAAAAYGAYKVRACRRAVSEFRE